VNMLMDVAVGQGLLSKTAADQQDGSSSSSSSSSSAISPAASAELHHLDKKAQTLGCDLVALSKDSDMYKTIEAAFVNTSTPAASCALSGFRAQATPIVTEVFEMQRHAELERFESGHFTGKGNVKLLWHGTNIAAGAAIVNGGVRIMPGAGGRLGRGLYFANEAGKSGHYVVKAPDGSALMFLAEVALGESHKITQDSREAQTLRAGRLPDQCDSTRAHGRSGPPPSGDVAMDLGGGRVATLATGKPEVRTEAEAQSSSFTNDEFVIYHEEQVRLRYCVRIHF